MRRKVSEELGNGTVEARGVSPPHSFSPWLPSPVAVTGLAGCASVCSGLISFHVYVACHSSYCSLLCYLASLSPPLLPPPPPRLPLLNSGSTVVSVAAPPPAFCPRPSLVCLLVFPCAYPLFSPVFSSQECSDALLCAPPVALPGTSSVVFLQGSHVQEVLEPSLVIFDLYLIWN